MRDLLLTRRGVVFIESAEELQSDRHVRAVEIELADLGYVLSWRLRKRLTRCSLEELVAFRMWTQAVLQAHVGGNQRHEPLFRRFPAGVPDDTLNLWWGKVLVHFLQAEGQPCLFCCRVGTTHVLNPCQHVICDRCWDGSMYSACPSCEHHVDRSSPFFRASPDPGLRGEKVLSKLLDLGVRERVLFKLLDLGGSMAEEAKTLFISLCERKQALSPADRDALVTILREYQAQVLSWLPATIPVRENVAIVFGTLFQGCEPSVVIRHARRFMTTATDVLRFIAILSGTDGSLQRETVFRSIEILEAPSEFWILIAKLIGAAPPGWNQKTVIAPRRVYRFKIAKLSRSLRRALLELLEVIDPDRLAEDMLRHRSYWVWVGQFLHPHEYASRFPNVARAFHIVRGKAPDGALAPRFQTWYARLDHAMRTRSTGVMLGLLAERPGELARRLDHALRTSADDATQDEIVATFASRVRDFGTPVLLTLRSHLSTRSRRAAIRVYWPKGRVGKGVSTPDQRAPLPSRVIGSAVRAIEEELLRRFAAKPAFPTCLLDEALRTVVVPFNERTVSPSAVPLPRGSRIPVPPGKIVRLFLHWCQPAEKGHTTDLDLSVAFYDESWSYVGVCSYYQLKLTESTGAVIAQSAGDLRDAPWPGGATEFVDLHREAARAAGIRYAVMVVNAYAGMPFSLLERGFAGVMLRDNPAGSHFDPRTVQLKFALDGENGIFLPFVLDIREDVLHWLDVHAKGQFEMNNVETSGAAITKICPELMTYFESGCRTSMFDLGLFHAAARCERVILRGLTVAQFVRRPGEDAAAFHARLVRGEADEPRSQLPRPDGLPIMAMLYRGDVELPEDSTAYALFRERITPSLAASDLLS